MSQEINITEYKKEFSREIPTAETISQIANNFSENRTKLLENADVWGLDPEFLLKQQEQVLVGPFVSPAPLATTFGGNLDNFNTAVNSQNELVKSLKRLGFKAKAYLPVTLSMSEIPVRGVEATDCLILPRNNNSNQKLMLVDSSFRNMPYSEVRISSSTLDEIKSKLLIIMTNTYMSRFPELRRQGGEKGKLIAEALKFDLEMAFRLSAENDTANYLNFSSILNTLISIRANSSSTFLNLNIDKEYYSPLLKKGIKDITKFTKVLKNIGFFTDNPGFVKINQNGKVRILKLDSIEENDVILRFDDDNSLINYSQLAQSNLEMAPCKELAYILCFANIVPVIYGSQNSGDFYEPYEIAKTRVQTLGFNPVMYRIQPQISEDYNQQQTIFDFYKQILYPEGV